MKKIYFATVLYFLTGSFKAQSLLFNNLIPSESINSTGLGVCSDSQGNVFATGMFSGKNLDFDPSINTYTLSSYPTSSGGFSEDLYVVKYNKYGSLKWAFNIGYQNKDIAYDICTDLSDNIIIGGVSKYNMNFNPASIAPYYTSLSTGFISKYDNNGNYIWSNTLLGDCNVYGICSDINGNVYATGNFTGQIYDNNSNTGPFILSSMPNVYNAFVIKYNSSGQFVWAFSMPSSNNFNSGKKINIDPFGDLIVVGYFSGSCDFDPSGLVNNLTEHGNSDGFIAKYSNNGSFVWAHNIGGSQPDEVRNLISDKFGNIYFTGFFGDIGYFNSLSPSYNLVSNGWEDIFLAKFNSSGSHIWSFNIGAQNSDESTGIALDSSNNVLITGYFQNNPDFDPSANQVIFNGGNGNHIYTARYNPNGQYQAGFYLKDSLASAKSNDICIDFENNLIITGDMDGYVDFEPLPNISNVYNSYHTPYIAKYAPTWTSIKEETEEINLSIYPVPTKTDLNIDFEKQTEANLIVYDSFGKCVLNNIINKNKNIISITTFADGIYFIKVLFKDGSFLTKKIIIIK